MFNQYILKIALISSSLITSVIATPLIANELAQDSDLVEQQTDEKNIDKSTKSSPEVLNVWGKRLSANEPGYTSPESLLLPSDMVGINAITTEDLVKYEPSLVIRRRFIGDANGTIGIRSANMFQTARSMVFADGVPLHYYLESRWSGAPRWTMVSASEIAQVSVLYGPFSAQYGGNAMGGVINIETEIPQEREFNADLSMFTQQAKAYDFDEDVSGYKTFVSFGDKVNNLSYYVSFNHLDNDAQPQTFRSASASGSDQQSSKTGGSAGVDSRNRDVYWYGDTGIVTSQTNNYKVKIGYQQSNWQALFNLAYEDRSSDNVGQSYIRDATGNKVYSANNEVINGTMFSFNSSGLNDSHLLRESLSLGLRLKVELSDDIELEANINQFDILKDETRTSALHPNDPAFNGNGKITDYDDSGWTTGDVTVTVSDFIIPRINLLSGIRHEDYQLNLNVYNTDDYLAGDKQNYSSSFGGETQLNAIFAQLNWSDDKRWDMTLGLRYEQFESSNGYYSEVNKAINQLELVAAPSVEYKKTSPKFTIGYYPADKWLVRYSIAKAYRFPIVEELFRQYQAYNSINESNPNLAPENGFHQNLMLNRDLDGGYVRVNLFYDQIDDAIESQSTTIIGGINDGTNLSTFVPLDKTETKGAEFIFNQANVGIDGLDLRFNMTYTHARITENSANPEWEGNVYPRMPKWRANLLSTYAINDDWNVSVNAQYASDVYARLQNDDIIDQVYGAADSYLLFGFKSQYMINDELKASVGIDNLTNELT
ncbi:MAG: TonB-dependent receptor [Pseudoalteromonas prydzensis]